MSECSNQPYGSAKPGSGGPGARTLRVPVLVVGAGPVGLALSVLLGRFGVDHLIVDRNRSTTEHPKSRGCTARTMETFRVWGLEDRIRRGALPAGSDNFWGCEAAAGPVLYVTHPEPPSLHTPSPKCMVAQDVVEEALADAVGASRHATLLRLCELSEFDQDETGVRARLRHLTSGEDLEVNARYMVACDGAGSHIRRQLGIELIGPDLLALLANYYYRADVSHLPHVRQTTAFDVRPRDPSIPPAMILATGNTADRWLYIQRLDHEGQPLHAEDELAAIVRGHWGIADLKVELINVMTWRMSAQIPSAFRRERVILAGDAAHRFPPTGGMGLNSGVQDAQNLGWKLALVLRGLAPDCLLDTYETERRQVAVSNCEWSTGNFRRMETVLIDAYARRDQDPLQWRQAILDLDNHLNSEGQALGHIYQDGALIDDGSPVPPHDHRYYWPCDRPGARFPHLWLDPSWRESTIDWFDTAFVLVCGTDAAGWAAAGEKVARSIPVPLQIRRLPTMAGPLSIGPDGAVLVRPDGHVAWRPDRACADEAGALEAAITLVLYGNPASEANCMRNRD
jgi:2-polyprenyl-6-methoxyphenol hydroxylase-like FAD-dependent oxidoreductase